MKRYLCGESVKGASHVRQGAPLQDSNRIEEISNTVTILAVADGHGSEKCPRSDRGSAIAVNAFCYVMNKYLTSYDTEKNGMATLVAFLNREGDTRFAQDVCSEWQARVKQSFYKNRDENFVNADGSYDWERIFSLYGTTLLGVLITETFVFSFQIGDGDIMLITSDSIAPVVESEKFLGTETHSLSKVGAWKHSATSLRMKDIEDDTPYLYMLTTDGFANSHASDEDFQKSCRDYYNMIGQHGFDAIKENLRKWLTETSENGCGDDITAVLAYIDK